MKITAQEEYGLRILLRIAKSAESAPGGLAIPEISRTEGLSHHNVAKLCRVLRMRGFIQSTRGKDGGYTLSRPAEDISVGEVFAALGGRLFDESFCQSHTGVANLCTNSIDCTIRSLWEIIQTNVDEILAGLSIKDLLGQNVTPQMLTIKSLNVAENRLCGIANS